MYTIQQVSRLAGITSRTLRYYHETGLLIPKQTSTNNYRIYSEEDLDILQQILIYKSLGLSLKDIKSIIHNPNFDILNALHNQLSNLKTKKDELDTLIHTINQTISSIEGGEKMSSKDKFNGLKRKEVMKNEAKYGHEIRKKYGNKNVDESNNRYLNMSQEQHSKAGELASKILDTLTEAFKLKDPQSSLAQEACKYHQEWIKIYWPKYTKEAHLGLVEMYTQDDRFKKYYEVCGKGATDFLYEAMKIYLA